MHLVDHLVAFVTGLPYGRLAIPATHYFWRSLVLPPRNPQSICEAWLKSQEPDYHVGHTPYSGCVISLPNQTKSFCLVAPPCPAPTPFPEALSPPTALSSNPAPPTQHEMKSHERDRSDNGSGRRYRPLSACGYGPENFTFLEYNCSASPSPVEDSATLERSGNPFKGLGFSVDVNNPDSLSIPSRRQVRNRVKALQELWALGEPTQLDTDLDNEGTRVTGLSRQQLQTIWMSLEHMEDHVNELLKKEEFTGGKGDSSLQEWLIELGRGKSWKRMNDMMNGL